MFRVTYGLYTLFCTTGHLPDMYRDYCCHAELASEYALREPKETPQSQSPCFVGISKIGHNDGWPVLTIAQTYSPDFGDSFPGAIIIPETDIVLLGAGTRLLAYALNPPRLLWEDDANFGFWGWERHGDTIIMAAELEMAAWDIEGCKLWSRFVEPPWSYQIEEGVVQLDIMGIKSRFPLSQDQSCDLPFLGAGIQMRDEMCDAQTVTLKIESAHGEAAGQLIAALTADLYGRYGYGGECGFHPDDTEQPGGAFVVARLNGAAVGCGALRPQGPGVGEIKRMYVVPEARGRGLSRRILQRLEDLARAFGYHTLRLETGDRQPEARGLYESEGYHAIPSYDPEAHDEHSRCYEKAIPTPA